MSKKVRRKDFLSKLQCYLQNQIPEDIIIILRQTGYDTTLALETLTFEEIGNLEEYITEERKDIINLLNNTAYLNLNPFALLPGHKAVLLGLKKKLEQFQNFQSESEQGKHRSQRLVDFESCIAVPSEITITGTHLPVSKLNQKVAKFVSGKNINCANGNYTQTSDIHIENIEKPRLLAW